MLLNSVTPIYFNWYNRDSENSKHWLDLFEVPWHKIQGQLAMANCKDFDKWMAVRSAEYKTRGLITSCTSVNILVLASKFCTLYLLSRGLNSRAYPPFPCPSHLVLLYMHCSWFLHLLFCIYQHFFQQGIMSDLPIIGTQHEYRFWPMYVNGKKWFMSEHMHGSY